ncbi:MAG: hypothetical protein AAF484_04895 [Pseudomonadota bacterium]
MTLIGSSVRLYLMEIQRDPAEKVHSNHGARAPVACLVRQGRVQGTAARHPALAGGQKRVELV